MYSKTEIENKRAFLSNSKKKPFLDGHTDKVVNTISCDFGNNLSLFDRIFCAYMYFWLYFCPLHQKSSGNPYRKIFDFPQLFLRMPLRKKIKKKMWFYPLTAHFF